MGRLKVGALRRLAALLGVLGISGPPAQAKVLLQGFYWDVPSPAAGSPAAPWWWDHLSDQAKMLRDAGFTAIWLPPVMKGNSGGYSVGYDPFDDYDLGSKPQKGTVPLRYGNREQLERCVAVLRANGLNVYVDLVENHRNGDDGHFNFRYRDAYGQAGAGRFPKGLLDFHPNVRQDPGVPDGASEMQFGRDLAPINGRDHYIYRGLISGGDWLTRALGIQGYRLDFVRGVSTEWLRPFLDAGAMHGKFAVGEFWDEDRARVEDWVQRGMRGRSSAFDFPLRGLLKKMCDSHGYFDMARLDHAGLLGIDPAHAVTFVENHDTDRSSQITRNKALAYAYILTSEGYPSVFYKDYAAESGCRGMKPILDRLIRIHETIAAGGAVVRWKDRDAFVFERIGGRRLLVGLNDNERDSQSVTVRTGFAAGARLQDYAGHGPDLLVQPHGIVKMAIPSDVDGRGYVAYSLPGAPRVHPSAPQRVTQEYAGARDLDIKPADPAGPVQVCRIWAASGAPIRARLRCDIHRWTGDTTVRLDILDSSGVRLASCAVRRGGGPCSGLRVEAAVGGWYTFRISSAHTPTGNPYPAYWLDVSYLGGDSAASAVRFPAPAPH